MFYDSERQRVFAMQSLVISIGQSLSVNQELRLGIETLGL